MFSAVIFDCDGVLVDSEILGLDDSATYLQSYGLNWSPADLVRLFTGYRMDVFGAKLTEAYRKVHEADPPADFFDGLVEQRRKNKDKLKPVAGAEGAIKAARDRFGIGVASSSQTVFLEAKLQRTGLWDLVAPHVYSADLVRHGKPAPDVFLYTAEKLSVAPSKCIVIEDSANGVKAGVAAGMEVWGFTGGGHCFDGHSDQLIAAGASRIVEDFASLAVMFDQSKID